MTNAQQNLPENYIQEMLETYADGLEKHKENNKAVLIDLLKKSDERGKRIDSFEDYETLQSTVAEIETNGSLSWLQKLGLKDLKAFIASEYPQYGKQWLEKKHKAEKESFSKLFPQSETQEKYLTRSYIDTLIAENDLEQWSINQLNRIFLLVKGHNTKIDANRLTIRKNLVCIDGFTIPAKEEDRTKQYYKEMKKDPEWLTYPWYAEKLLTFAAEITGKKFTFPAKRGKLQKGEIDGEQFIKEINTDTNKAIIKTLHNIVWFNSVIPVWLDKDGYVIYVAVRSDFFSFDRFSSDVDNCLVSAA